MANNIRNTADQPPLLTLLELTAGGPRAIEAMEARGQRELVSSTVLPTEGLTARPTYTRASDRAYWEAVGVKIGAPVEGDPLFTHVELPAGWSKRATGHSMHSELVDDRGRVRGGIFYKAASYDRRASLARKDRFAITTPYKQLDREGLDVLDGERVINMAVFDQSVGDYETREPLFRCPIVVNPVYDERGQVREDAHPAGLWRRCEELEREQRDACLAWLNARYPNHADPIKQWEDQ